MGKPLHRLGLDGIFVLHRYHSSATPCGIALIQKSE